jgi:hypothetical protein
MSPVREPHLNHDPLNNLLSSLLSAFLLTLGTSFFKFFYKSQTQIDSQSFHYQFLLFFSPTTLHAQWVRLWQVVALLKRFINLCAHLKNNQEDWKLGMLVGFLLDSEIANDDDKLVKAYQFLGVPITGPYVPESLKDYTLADARDTLLGHQEGKSTPVLIFKFANDLEDNNDNALDYLVINPGYDPAEYATDGHCLTNAE